VCSRGVVAMVVRFASMAGDDGARCRFVHGVREDEAVSRLQWCEVGSVAKLQE